MRQEGQIWVLKDPPAYVVEFAGALVILHEGRHVWKIRNERLRQEYYRLLGLAFWELVNFGQTLVRSRLEQHSLCSDGVFVGHHTINGGNGYRDGSWRILYRDREMEGVWA